jgi:hypothetical protein
MDTFKSPPNRFITIFGFVCVALFVAGPIVIARSLAGQLWVGMGLICTLWVILLTFWTILNVRFTRENLASYFVPQSDEVLIQYDLTYIVQMMEPNSTDMKPLGSFCFMTNKRLVIANQRPLTTRLTHVASIPWNAIDYVSTVFCHIRESQNSPNGTTPEIIEIYDKKLARWQERFVEKLLILHLHDGKKYVVTRDDREGFLNQFANIIQDEFQKEVVSFSDTIWMIK